MGQLEDLRLFVSVIDAGGISKAADEMNIVKSAVSRRLGLLEDRFQAQLIDRRPGLWKVTDKGQELYQRAVSALTEVDDIDADFIGTSADLSGPLSVSVPHEFGLSDLKGALIAFQVKYPQIALNVDFDERIVDLDRENFDFAIRITATDSRNNALSCLRPVKHGLYASPTYLSKHGTPTTLEHLAHHQLLLFGHARRAEWHLFDEKGKQHIHQFRPYLSSNNGLFLRDACIQGLGLSRFPDFILGDTVQSGKLVPVLPQLQMPDWGVYLLKSDNRRLNRRMRVFAEEMEKACLQTG